jgi:mannose-1-phosphate guanylyltransferase
MNLSNTDIIILAGGLGTRLRGVLPDTPKILAPIGGGQTYLDFLLRWLGGQGAAHAILALGYHANKVEQHLIKHSPPFKVTGSVEDKPLGTAGALRLAADYAKSDPVLVLNGDSWADIDLNVFIRAHRDKRAALSLLCTPVKDASRYGTLEIAADGTLSAFREKDASRSGEGIISAGAYLFSRKAMDELHATPGASLEQDFFEKRLDLKPQAFRGSGAFIDIGTPESLEQAPFILKH